MRNMSPMEENLRFNRKCREAAAYKKAVEKIVGDLWDIIEFEDPYCPRRALITRSGKVITVREKFRRRNYQDILVETKRLDGSEGWVWDRETQGLLYTMVPAEITYFIPMDLLAKVTVVTILRNAACRGGTVAKSDDEDMCLLDAEADAPGFVEEPHLPGLRAGLLPIPLAQIIGQDGVQVVGCRGLLAEIQVAADRKSVV